MNISKDLETPLYKQMVDHIKNMIRYGFLPPGKRISTRGFAAEYGISKGVVETAFEILKSEGYVESFPKSGTYVSQNAWITMMQGAMPDWQRYSSSGFYQSNREILHQINSRASNPNVLNIGSYGFNPEEFDSYRPLINALELIRDPVYVSRFDTYDMRGLACLREEISEHLKSLGIRAGPDNIIVFNSWMDACTTIFHSLLSHGSNSFIHANDMINAMRMLTTIGVNVHLLEHDEEGILPEDILNKASGRKHSMLYVNLTNHFPTGATSGAYRRDKILKAVQKLNIPVIENDMMRCTWLEAPPPPLKSGDIHEQVIYIGTFDNTNNSAVKGAWAVVPSVAVERICDVKVQYYGRNNTVLELLMYIMLTSGDYTGWTQTMRRKLPERIHAVNTLFMKHLSGIATWNLKNSLYHAWIEFLPEIDTQKLFMECPGVYFLAGTTYHSRRHILINSVNPSLDVLDQALGLIVEAAKKQISR